MAIQSAKERVEMALYDFEMAVESAAHDMSGWAERSALKQARADLAAALAARDDAIRAEEREACARLADYSWGDGAGPRAGAAIRARASEPAQQLPSWVGQVEAFAKQPAQERSEEIDEDAPEPTDYLKRMFREHGSKKP